MCNDFTTESTAPVLYPYPSAYVRPLCSVLIELQTPFVARCEIYLACIFLQAAQSGATRDSRRIRLCTLSGRARDSPRPFAILLVVRYSDNNLCCGVESAQTLSISGATYREGKAGCGPSILYPSLHSCNFALCILRDCHLENDGRERAEWRVQGMTWGLGTRVPPAAVFAGERVCAPILWRSAQVQVYKVDKPLLYRFFKYLVALRFQSPLDASNLREVRRRVRSSSNVSLVPGFHFPRQKQTNLLKLARLDRTNISTASIVTNDLCLYIDIPRQLT